MRVNTPQLKEEERLSLESGYRTGSQPCFRNRCHTILLKSAGRDSKDVGKIVGMCENSVNKWVRRYKELGIEGLHNVPGQGRKPIISQETDGETIKTLVSEHRQRVSVAHSEWESASDKTVSNSTFRRFLKVLVAPIEESENVVKDKPTL